MAAGLGSAQSRGRGRRGRVNPPGTGMLNPPGQGGYPPKRGPGGRLGGSAPASRGKGRGQGTGISAAGLPGPGGRQLAARVASGAITQQQAQQTLQQRQTLAKALGSNWRDKLKVGGKSFAQVNRQIKANPDSAQLAALRKRLLENRNRVLEGARKKNSGEGQA